MDVEGAETSVLKGAVQTLRTFHPPMIVELHNDPSQEGPHPAIPLLEESGYEIEWLNEADYRSPSLLIGFRAPPRADKCQR